MSKKRKEWVIADLHFGHKALLVSNGGTRPFATVEEMDEHLVRTWNSFVGPKDKVFVLGDIAINRRNLNTLARCNGLKDLIIGNHDILSFEFAATYLSLFRVITASVKIRQMLLTHMPVRSDCLGRANCLFNIHGHLHEAPGSTPGDHVDAYYCCSVEQTGYAPILLEGIEAEMYRRIGK